MDRASPLGRASTSAQPAAQRTRTAADADGIFCRQPLTAVWRPWPVPWMRGHLASARLGSAPRFGAAGPDAAARAKRREAAQLLPPPRQHKTAGLAVPCRSTPRRAASGGPTGGTRTGRAEWTRPRDIEKRRERGTPTNQSPIPERKPTTCALCPNLPLQSLPSCSTPTSDKVDHLNHPVRGNGQTTSPSVS